MPTTRSQVQEKSEKKTRASRKRIQLVFNYCNPLSFDFAASKKTETDMDSGSEAKKPKKMIVSEADQSSARTRTYSRPEKEKKVLEPLQPEVQSSSQDEDDIQIIEENVRNRGRVVKVSSTGKKSIWITHVATIPKAPSPEPGIQTAKSSQETQESDGDVSGVKATNKLSSKPKTVLDLSQVPRYLLNPNAFENNPAMKERILKSIYDRERRDRDMKKLTEENLQLKQMATTYWLALNQKQQDGVCFPPPVVSVPPVKTVAPNESIFNASVPFHLGSAYQKKSSQAQNDSEGNILLPSGTVMTFPVPPAVPKRHRKRNTPTQPRQSRKRPTKAQKLEREKEYLTSLYEQFDKDTEQDMDSIWEAINDAKDLSSSPSSTNSSGDVTPGRNKRKQEMTLRNAKETEVVDKQGEEDEIQIIEEIRNGPETFATLIKKKYSDVIFEEA